MNNILLSIIVPCYNAEKTIERLVDSIGYNKECEIILVNDGSFDNTLNILKKLKNKYKNIVIIDKNNKGVSDTRNKGIEKSKGEWICFADSDDYYDNNFLDTIIPILKKCEYDSINFGYEIVYDNKESIIGKPVMKDEIIILKDPLKEFLNLDGILKKICWSPWARVYRSKIIKNHDIKFNTSKKIGEDLLFNAEYFSYCKNAKNIANIIYKYYQSENSLTRSGYNKTLYDEINIYNKAFMDFTKKTEKKNYEKYISNFYISQLFTLLINESYSKNKKKSKLVIKKYIENDILKYSNVFSMKFKIIIYYLIIKTKLIYLIFNILFLKNSR